MGNPHPRPRLLPRKLLIIRQHLKLTQTAIKDCLDLSTAARISEYENGRRKPRLFVTFGYSRLARLPMESLLDDTITLPEFWNQLSSIDYREIENARQQVREPLSPAQMNVCSYTVQPPLTFGHKHQQIRATIGGTAQIAGSVEMSRIGRDKAYISNLKVAQQHRRRGVAAKLIDAVISSARHQGFKVATLEARPFDKGISLQALMAMYRRRGFRNVGTTRRGSPLME